MLATTEHRPFYDGEWVSIFSTGQRYTWVEVAPGLYDKRWEVTWEELANPSVPIRMFETGATRDTEEGKFDYEGFLSPVVVEEFAAYMHRHRMQADGSLRDADNWQKGIPRSAYMKSAWRHFFDWWKRHRAGESGPEVMESLMALLFNVQGYAFELRRGGKKG